MSLETYIHTFTLNQTNLCKQYNKKEILIIETLESRKVLANFSC